MRDANQNYPMQQSGGNGRHQPYDDENEDELDEEGLTMDPVESDEHYGIQLPQKPVAKALIVGLIAGFICALQSVVVTVANSSTYQAYVSSGTQQSVQNAIALTLVGLACLTFSLSMLICFVAGYITGKVAVLRRMGFLTGFVAGVIIYALSFLLNYIPGYPTHLASSGGRGLIGVGGGILASLIFLLLWGVIGGLASLAGAWFATRKHAYYKASS